jgi:hypothetical protein
MSEAKLSTHAYADHRKRYRSHFAGSVDQDKVMSMTQARLEIMGSDSPFVHDSRMMLLGALAALGQAVSYPVFADIGGSHEPPPADIAP